MTKELPNWVQSPPGLMQRGISREYWFRSPLRYAGWCSEPVHHRIQTLEDDVWRVVAAPIRNEFNRRMGDIFGRPAHPFTWLRDR